MNTRKALKLGILNSNEKNIKVKPNKAKPNKSKPTQKKTAPVTTVKENNPVATNVPVTPPVQEKPSNA